MSKALLNRQDAKTPRLEPAERLDELARQVVDVAFCVHTKLGPGLLESVYEVCMEYELKKRGLQVAKQVSLPVVYDNLEIEGGLRLDLLVEDVLVVELKAVECFLPVHQAQVMTYLKLTGNQLGLLINFNVPLIKNGIKRIILQSLAPSRLGGSIL